MLVLFNRKLKKNFKISEVYIYLEEVTSFYESHAKTIESTQLISSFLFTLVLCTP